MISTTTFMKSVHGSHLYGLDTPSSDRDFKGIFMPNNMRDLALRQVPSKFTDHSNKTSEKNTAGDIDLDVFELKTFIDMACDGEMIALDMIHTPEECTELLPDYAWVWHRIRNNRNLFYTKSMKAYVGYARKQAAKYGIKGSRLAVLEEALDALKFNLARHEDITVAEVDGLPLGEHSCNVTTTTTMGEQHFYEILGSKYQHNSSAYTMYESLQAKWDKYGARAMQAKANDGVDWKAVSHAFRAAYQLESIFTIGDVEFPFVGETKSFLLDVKCGKLNFINEVQPRLEEAIDKVLELADNSPYPRKVNREFWYDLCWEAYSAKS